MLVRFMESKRTNEVTNGGSCSIKTTKSYNVCDKYLQAVVQIDC